MISEASSKFEKQRDEHRQKEPCVYFCGFCLGKAGCLPRFGKKKFIVNRACVA